MTEQLSSEKASRPRLNENELRLLDTVLGHAIRGHKRRMRRGFESDADLNMEYAYEVANRFREICRLRKKLKKCSDSLARLEPATHKV
jgi:hypothetical protein